MRGVARSLVTAVVATLCAASACSGDAVDESMTTALTEQQRTASTVARPDTPPPCDPDEVTTWTARTEAVGDAASGVIRVRNDGPATCEVDIEASERVDRFVEPDVWLEPGAGADLVVGDGGQGCDDPKVVLDVEVAIGPTSRRVPTSAVVPCDWRLVAFYPAEPPQGACDAPTLDVTRVDRAIVLRNPGFTSCALGALVGVEGARLAASIDELPTIDWLAGGDVVAFPVTTTDTTCEPAVVALRFGSAAGDVTVGGTACDVVGPGVSYYAGDLGPLAGFVEPVDVEAAVAALDPFVDG